MSVYLPVKCVATLHLLSEILMPWFSEDRIKMVLVEMVVICKITALDSSSYQTETPSILQGDVISLGFRINHAV